MQESPSGSRSAAALPSMRVMSPSMRLSLRSAHDTLAVGQVAKGDTLF